MKRAWRDLQIRLGLRQPDVLISARIMHADGTVTDLGQIAKGSVVYEARKA